MRATQISAAGTQNRRFVCAMNAMSCKHRKPPRRVKLKANIIVEFEVCHNTPKIKQKKKKKNTERKDNNSKLPPPTAVAFYAVYTENTIKTAHIRPLTGKLHSELNQNVIQHRLLYRIHHTRCYCRFGVCCWSCVRHRTSEQEY